MTVLGDTIWKPIPGFEGQYEVSDHGEVRSLARRVPTVIKGKRTTMPVPARVLKPGRTSSGHVSVVLGRKGGSHCIHVLVLTAFVGPRPPGMDACHNDDVPDNNVLSNLRWDTRTNNILDAVRNGTWFSESRKVWLKEWRKRRWAK